ALLVRQEHQLGVDQARDVVVDRAVQEDDTVLEQARVDVVRALATRALLDDHRYDVLERTYDSVRHASLLRTSMGVWGYGRMGAQGGETGRAPIRPHFHTTLLPLPPRP